MAALCNAPYARMGRFPQQTQLFGGARKEPEEDELPAVPYTPTLRGCNDFSTPSRKQLARHGVSTAVMNLHILVSPFLSGASRRIKTKLHKPQPAAGNARRTQYLAECYDVALHNGAKGLPPKKRMPAATGSEGRHGTTMCMAGSLSWFCRHVLGRKVRCLTLLPCRACSSLFAPASRYPGMRRQVTYGDLTYMLTPLSQEEQDKADVQSPVTVEASLEYMGRARAEKARNIDDAQGHFNRMAAKGGMPHLHGCRVAVEARDVYAPSTCRNHSHAAVIIASTHLDLMVRRKADASDRVKAALKAGSDVPKSLRQAEELAEREVDHAQALLADMKNAQNTFTAKARASQRERASLEHKKYRYAEQGKVVAALEKVWPAVSTMPRCGPTRTWVEGLCRWVLMATTTFAPPVRKSMYLRQNVSSVTWCSDSHRWHLMLPSDFKNSVTSPADRVALPARLTRPFAMYLEHRYGRGMMSCAIAHPIHTLRLPWQASAQRTSRGQARQVPQLGLVGDPKWPPSVPLDIRHMVP